MNKHQRQLPTATLIFGLFGLWAGWAIDFRKYMTLEDSGNLTEAQIVEATQGTDASAVIYSIYLAVVVLSLATLVIGVIQRRPN